MTAGSLQRGACAPSRTSVSRRQRTYCVSAAAAGCRPSASSAGPGGSASGSVDSTEWATAAARVNPSRPSTFHAITASSASASPSQSLYTNSSCSVRQLLVAAVASGSLLLGSLLPPAPPLPHAVPAFSDTPTLTSTISYISNSAAAGLAIRSAAAATAAPAPADGASTSGNGSGGGSKMQRMRELVGPGADTQLMKQISEELLSEEKAPATATPTAGGGAGAAAGSSSSQSGAGGDQRQQALDPKARLNVSAVLGFCRLRAAGRVPAALCRGGDSAQPHVGLARHS